MANAITAAVPKRCGATRDAETSDQELLERFNAERGELAETAFEGLVHRHGPMVLRVCGQILDDWHGAEDAFQATFLVLARRSGSIRRPELLGNWLYGVALRTAREAKMRDGRRREREASAEDLPMEPDGQPGQPDSALIRREEFEALHEELARLPERYRVPVVLCELEGLSYREVARRMHCPVSTVGVRLVRGRERLRIKLIRRGIMPAAVLTNAMFGAEGALSLLPSPLVDSTVRAAVAFAVCDAAAAGAVSTAVIALSRAILRVMTIARLKLTTNVVLLVGITATLGWVGGHRQSGVPTSAGPTKARLQEIAGIPASVVPTTPAARSISGLSPRPNPANLVETIRPGNSGLVVEAMLHQEEKPAPLPTLTMLQQRIREERTRGETLFFKEWVPNDPKSPHGDGLGPVFNETSCVGCHGLGAPGGAGPETKNVVVLTAIPTNGGPVSVKGLERIHPGFAGVRSTVLHRYGTDPEYGSWRMRFFEDNRSRAQSEPPNPEEETVEARIRRIAAQTGPQSRSRQRASRLQLASGITLRVSERNTPALFGAGKIDEISSEVLIEEARRQPAGVRGRVNRDRAGRVGRFGWKAQIASLHEFVRIACAGELGLEVPGHSQSPSPLAPREKAKGLDLTEPECDALVSFVRALPVPVVIDPSGPQGSEEMVEGRRLFAEVGCVTCHSPSLGQVRGIYSDLLLHDMGTILGDSGVSYGNEGPESPGGPSPGEWRTPPLWGFRDSAPYLHDGRAENLEEAVALHGGQGTNSARQFFSLTPAEQVSVEVFLKSLVAPSHASAPGLILAAELEERIEPEKVRQAEALVRKQREQADALEVERLNEFRRHRIAQAAKKLASIRLLMATNLERAGRVSGSLEWYRLIIRDAPESEEGQSAAARISVLQTKKRGP